MTETTTAMAMPPEAIAAIQTLENVAAAAKAGSGHDPLLDNTIANLMGWGQRMNVSGKPGDNRTPPISASSDAGWDLAAFVLGDRFAGGSCCAMVTGGQTEYRAELAIQADGFGTLFAARHHKDRGRAMVMALMELSVREIYRACIVDAVQKQGHKANVAFWTSPRGLNLRNYKLALLGDRAADVWSDVALAYGPAAGKA